MGIGLRIRFRVWFIGGVRVSLINFPQNPFIRTIIDNFPQPFLQDVKMRKMAELQLNVVGDPKSKTAILKQISQWEDNLEKLHVELYRVRCYVSSLQGCELPNPKGSLIQRCDVFRSYMGQCNVVTPILTILICRVFMNKYH